MTMDRIDQKLPAQWLLLFPGLPYLASLVVPASPRGDLPGYELILIGSLGVAAGSFSALLYLMPNPLLWVGTYLLHQGRVKAVLCMGALATILALLPIINSDRSVAYIIGSPANVAWIVSMCLLVIAGYLGLLFTRKTNASPKGPWAVEHELSPLGCEVRQLTELS
jgi:hypothetical protein